VAAAHIQQLGVRLLLVVGGCDWGGMAGALRVSVQGKGRRSRVPARACRVSAARKRLIGRVRRARGRTLSARFSPVRAMSCCTVFACAAPREGRSPLRLPRGAS
jgi:hypothetical protein